MRLDMRPHGAGNNLFDKGQAYAKHVGKLLTWSALARQFSNTKNIRFSQLGGWIRFTGGAMALTVAILGNHIINVVLASTKKQMIRVDARRIVATVQHPQVISDWAIVQRIGVTMRRHLGLINNDLAVVTSASSGCPYPAGSLEQGVNRAVLIDLSPKALFDRCAPGRSTCMAFDKTFGLSLDPSIRRVGTIRDWCGLTASTFTEFWGDLLCIHKRNSNTNYTSRTWQIIDSFGGVSR